MVRAASSQDFQVAELDAAIEEYMNQMYGGSDAIPELQLREVRQAFLSGVHWLNTHPGHVPSAIQGSIRKILTRDLYLDDSSS